jgi:hypothetical protein
LSASLSYWPKAPTNRIWSIEDFTAILRKPKEESLQLLPELLCRVTQAETVDRSPTYAGRIELSEAWVGSRIRVDKKQMIQRMHSSADVLRAEIEKREQQSHLIGNFEPSRFARKRRSDVCFPNVPKESIPI